MTAEFRKKARSLLLLDIETVCSPGTYHELPERLQSLWDKKAASLIRKEDQGASPADLFYEKGAIYAEFGKVVCIAFGAFFWNEKEEISYKVRSFQGHDEAVLLQEFKALIEKYAPEELILCAHNGKEFDFPYLCRRMLINDISIPKALQIAGKKPWEVHHQDTMELWKFGDYKSYTSLDLLAAVFDIPGSKVEMSGDQVSNVYYQEKGLEKISRYCREDVVVLGQIYLRLHNMPLVLPSNISRHD
ncbi:3'-5' exonuclease [Dyadobacter tibetensis]|uniref:3'-5' exonuclease n=1 Tax=Dyadobacter tibetensis TaxID=1211851 RepID=UPI00046F9885|nr:3'-5' exonuclease [Dyadobacter tibetensis]